MIELEARAKEFRRLAGLVRSGEAPRSALVRWHEDADPELRKPLARVARRLCLGDDAEGACRSVRMDLGQDADTLARVFRIQLHCGGDLAAMIEMVASAIEDRSAGASAGRVSGAGAILSGRMVAALPLFCIPMIPMSRAPLFDPLGLAMLGTGVALALIGMRWLMRLVPVPPETDDPIAAIAEILAAVLGAGVGLHHALDHVTGCLPADIDPPFERTRRRVKLGMTWLGALSVSDDADLRALGRTLAPGDRPGVPVAAGLRRLARERRAERARAFDERTKRAPVVMVLPLVLCVLPSFLILALGPFVRGLGGI
ncbi:MAG: type II secretion system F family protein [Actinomycetota bacterium]|nr:type II secretion system F family protein [Actinomycetota bacterium]